MSFAARLAQAFAPRAEVLALGRPDTIVCRCEDVPLGRVAAAGSLRSPRTVLPLSSTATGWMMTQ